MNLIYNKIKNTLGIIKRNRKYIENLFHFNKSLLSVENYFVYKLVVKLLMRQCHRGTAVKAICSSTSVTLDFIHNDFLFTITIIFHTIIYSSINKCTIWYLACINIMYTWLYSDTLCT